ncbi:hypothetical protein FBB35_00360 [Nostoc sp. TCL240-02]|nr:hypothetical protein FBB35_00360 [Nostoc sp. TCL240-02]
MARTVICPLLLVSQRGLLPKGEASAKGVSPMSDWRTRKGYNFETYFVKSFASSSGAFSLCYYLVNTEVFKKF